MQPHPSGRPFGRRDGPSSTFRAVCPEGVCMDRPTGQGLRPTVFGGGFCPSKLSDNIHKCTKSVGLEGHSREAALSLGCLEWCKHSLLSYSSPCWWVTSGARESLFVLGCHRRSCLLFTACPGWHVDTRPDGWPGDQPLERTALSGHCGTRRHQGESLWPEWGGGPQGLPSKGAFRLGWTHRSRALTCPLHLAGPGVPQDPTVADGWVSEPSPGDLVPYC